jgi:hypothetical protein
MPSAIATAVGTTNSRVITLRVIADTRSDLPHSRKPPSAESGNCQKAISSGRRPNRVAELKTPADREEGRGSLQVDGSRPGEPGCRAKDPRQGSEPADRVPTRHFCEHSFQTVYLKCDVLGRAPISGQSPRLRSAQAGGWSPALPCDRRGHTFAQHLARFVLLKKPNG